MKFVKNIKYYNGVVYEWNLPTGSTCPFAMECKVTVDRVTGKFDIHRGQYKCYAAGPERFPGVREHRWKNFEHTKNGNKPILPKDCRAVRIHASGDFYNQEYFNMWVEIAKENPEVEFWAYTKSLNYWIKKINDIPKNLILTASRGGRLDYLIDQYNLKNVTIYNSEFQVPKNIPIDTNDDYARMPLINFGLIDNYAKKTKQIPLI
jgi:hypothetical protein